MRDWLFFHPSNQTIAALFPARVGALFWMAIREKEVAITKSIPNALQSYVGGLQSRIFEAEPGVSIFDRLPQAQHVDKHAPRFCRLMVPRRRSPALYESFCDIFDG